MPSADLPADVAIRPEGPGDADAVGDHVDLAFGAEHDPKDLDVTDATPPAGLSHPTPSVREAGRRPAWR